MRVTVQATDLAVVPDAAPMKPTRWEMFGTAFALTQISELMVAAAFLWRMKIERKLLVKYLFAIAFINLLTFPVVWFFFPALQPFQYITTRVFGCVSLGIAIGYSVFWVRQSEVTLKVLQRSFLIWLLSLPVVAAIAFVIALFWAMVNRCHLLWVCRL